MALRENVVHDSIWLASLSLQNEETVTSLTVVKMVEEQKLRSFPSTLLSSKVRQVITTVCAWLSSSHPPTWRAHVSYASLRHVTGRGIDDFLPKLVESNKKTRHSSMKSLWWSFCSSCENDTQLHRHFSKFQQPSFPTTFVLLTSLFVNNSVEVRGATVL